MNGFTGIMKEIDDMISSYEISKENVIEILKVLELRNLNTNLEDFLQGFEQEDTIDYD